MNGTKPQKLTVQVRHRLGRIKLDAHLRGLGAGFLPEPIARPYVSTGRLVARRVERSTRVAQLSYAWRANASPGKALSWWLEQLERPITRRALLEQQDAWEEVTFPEAEAGPVAYGELQPAA